MSDQHTHEPALQRRASLESKNRVLADQLSGAMNAAIEATALCEELESEKQMLSTMLTQAVAENRVLRKRLGIPEGAPVELTDEEAAWAAGGGALVEEQPDEEQPPNLEVVPDEA